MVIWGLFLMAFWSGIGLLVWIVVGGFAAAARRRRARRRRRFA